MRDYIYIGHMFKAYVFKINIYVENLPPQDAKTYVVEVIKYQICLISKKGIFIVAHNHISLWHEHADLRLLNFWTN